MLCPLGLRRLHLWAQCLSQPLSHYENLSQQIQVTNSPLSSIFPWSHLKQAWIGLYLFPTKLISHWVFPTTVNGNNSFSCSNWVISGSSLSFTWYIISISTSCLLPSKLSEFHHFEVYLCRYTCGTSSPCFSAGGHSGSEPGLVVFKFFVWWCPTPTALFFQIVHF